MTKFFLSLAVCAALACAQNPFSKVAPDKKASEAFENIKVLNDDPSTSVRGAMEYFNQALGVTCEGCHDLQAFDKDAKNMKKTAREMITMTRDINKNAFRGQQRITCFTCHQGNQQPTGVAPTPKPVNAPPPPMTRFPQGQAPKADEIIAKYHTAIGGAEKAAKIKTFVAKASETEPDGKTASVELRASGDKVSVETKTADRAVTEVSDGKDAWGKAAGQGPAGVYHVTDQLAPLLAHESEVYPGSRILSAAPAMRVVGTTKIGDRDALMMFPAQRSATNDRFYFDKDSGLLLRQVYSVGTLFGPLPTQIDYEDYRDVEGVKMPFKVKITRPEGVWSRTITSIKPNAPVDDASFAK